MQFGATNERETNMIISAKFASVCMCGKPITVGSKVEWKKGTSAVHAACAGKIRAEPTRTAAAGRRGRSADCRKYGWDGVRGSSSYYTSGQYDEES